LKALDLFLEQFLKHTKDEKGNKQFVKELIRDIQTVNRFKKYVFKQYSDQFVSVPAQDALVGFDCIDEQLRYAQIFLQYQRNLVELNKTHNHTDTLLSSGSH
jgi:hypothetical protein